MYYHPVPRPSQDGKSDPFLTFLRWGSRTRQPFGLDRCHNSMKGENNMLVKLITDHGVGW